MIKIYLSVIITVQMNDRYGTKRLAGENIALLGLFILSLLFACLITIAKSLLVLSEPIEFRLTGLSLSVPNGNGWHSEKQWKQQDNSFALISIFSPYSGRAEAFAHCQYLFAADRTSVQAKFEQKALLIDGVLVQTDRMSRNNLVIEWAQIKKPQTPVISFFGTTELPNNRQLDIEVRQITGNSNLAQKVFKRIFESLNFNDNGLLEAGSSLVAKIKSEGLGNLLDSQNQKVFFLIKTVGRQREHVVGFTMDVAIGSGQDANFDVQGAGLFYTRSPYVQERATSFQSDNNLDEFVWKCETHSGAERSGSEIIVDSNGAMTVRKSNEPRDKNYRLSLAAIPSIFLQQLFSVMLDSDKKEIVVDIIRSDGTITPTFISRVEAKDDADDKDTAYTLKLEPLGRKDFSEQVYIDGQKQVSKRVLYQETTFILERASLTDILREFPEKADSILRNNKTPDTSASGQI